MSVRFSCPCGQKLKTADGATGKRARCPKCSRWLNVPQSSVYETVAQEAPHGGKDKSSGPQGTARVAPPTDPVVSQPAEAKARVLVADSISDDLKKTSLLLRNHGYIVVEATDGAQALELTRSERPRAVILNVKLDSMSGFQVIQQLRNLANALNKEVWDTPILMTADKLHGRDKQYAMSLGVDAYFVKPVPPAQICAKLEKATAKIRSH